MKKRLKVVIAFLILMGILGGCSTPGQAGAGDGDGNPGQAQEDDAAKAQAGEDKEGLSGEGQDTGNAQGGQGAGDMAGSQSGQGLEGGSRPQLLKDADQEQDVSVDADVAPYMVEPDLGNVDNLWQFYFEDEMIEKLAQNGFVVSGDAGREFFEIYEMNRYSQIPNFVTVDSLMHTYHLYFSYLLKNVEREYLSESLVRLSRQMLENSTAQYAQLKGSKWESAARRNVAFFTVGMNLLGESGAVDGFAGDEAVADIVSYELGRIDQADGIYISEIRGDEEDYTQYIPRGYYAGDEELEKYFKAMMWYGRIHFSQKDEDMQRSALLITRALTDDPESYQLWEAIYAVTSFFAGASDDLGVCEYDFAIREAYGEGVPIPDLPGDDVSFESFCAITADMPAPQINSIPIGEGEDGTIPGFRFMGQRFTIDAAIMQKLIYSNVGEDSEGARRMLPDVLDVPAALGSDIALQILDGEGAFGYQGYKENMEKLREGLAAEGTDLWSASLYANWLNTLRPLLTVKGEGYPMFMQGTEWAKKSLECFAGSFTELKHDTVLYSKQVIAEMGGGDMEEVDDRGYVEPEPLVYGRFVRLADLTAQGLKDYGMLSVSEKEDLGRLSEMAQKLLDISQKELRDEVLTDDEYEFILTYGGSIEHFWYEAMKAEGASDTIDSQEYPAAVVVDIATDPNGQVLEAATGDPSDIYVVVKVDGKIKIARGSVFSFYQFPWPLDQRLTDQEWREMMGIAPGEDGFYDQDGQVERPGWTASYRY